jgi:hypothetical protein
MAVKTHGYARQRAVPHFPATTAKVCRKCDAWFASRPREAVCDGCVPPSVRTERALKTPSPAHHTRPASRAGKRAGQGGQKSTVRQVFSESLGLTFRCSVKDPRAARLECRVLAYEAAAAERRKYGRAA